jgi:hypothetical protein
MRTLIFCLLVLAGCATVPPAPPLTGADIVFLAKSGKTAPQIIEDLQRSGTVLPLQASDIVSLHESGVPREVLDYLLRVQIEEIRRRDMLYWGPMHGGFGGWPGFRR